MSLRLIALKKLWQDERKSCIFIESFWRTGKPPVVLWNRLSTRQLLQLNLSSLDNANKRTFGRFSSQCHAQAVMVLRPLLPYNLVQCLDLEIRIQQKLLAMFIKDSQSRCCEVWAPFCCSVCLWETTSKLRRASEVILESILGQKHGLGIHTGLPCPSLFKMCFSLQMWFPEVCMLHNKQFLLPRAHGEKKWILGLGPGMFGNHL
jgi:hypothetical protein